MRFLDRVLVLIGIVCFLTTTTLSSSDKQSLDMLLDRLSPKPVQDLGDLVNGWNVVGNGEQETPGNYAVVDDQISPDENWLHSNGYKYLGKLKQHNVLGDFVLPGVDYGAVLIPKIQSRNIITAPTICPEGERPDAIERCREVLGNAKTMKKKRGYRGDRLRSKRKVLGVL